MLKLIAQLQQILQNQLLHLIGIMKVNLDLCLQDVILTVGNEMLKLEAPMSYRCRWFEYLAYRPLLEKYYDEDPNMRWESVP